MGALAQRLYAVGLEDGTVSFSDSHSRERMADPQVRAVKERVELVADPKLMDPDAPRSGFVEVDRGASKGHLVNPPTPR